LVIVDVCRSTLEESPVRRFVAAVLVTLSASFVLLVSGCRAGDLVPRNRACERAWVLTGKAEDIGLWIPDNVAVAATRHCDDDVAAADEVSWNKAYPDGRGTSRCPAVTSTPATDDASRLVEAECVGEWADFVQFMDDRPRSCVEPANMQSRRETSAAAFQELTKVCSADLAAEEDKTTFGEAVGNGLAYIAVGIAGLLLLYGLFRGAFSD
jgi:hypothetical protein